MIGGALRIVDAGWGTTIQDLGRHGLAHLGVPRAGAVDRRAHALVNRLVGNPADAATLETTRGLVVEALRAVIVATSADGVRHTLRAGERLRVDAAPFGMWAYLAVRGGIDVEPVLGSRSHDTLSGLGPPAIVSGIELGVGDDPLTDLVADHAPLRQPEQLVRIWEGPRLDWFSGGLVVLTSRHWLVTSDVGRVGVRLAAGIFPLDPSVPLQMPSEGLVEGAVQITPSGGPIVMLANHPTTGGYPVIAVVDPDDVAIVAQARPGSTLRFRAA